MEEKKMKKGYALLVLALIVLSVIIIFIFNKGDGIFKEENVEVIEVNGNYYPSGSFQKEGILENVLNTKEWSAQLSPPSCPNNPYEYERCFDGVDDNCDGNIDEGCVMPKVSDRLTTSMQGTDTLRVWFYSDIHLTSDEVDNDVTDWQDYMVYMDQAIKGMEGEYDVAFINGDFIFFRDAKTYVLFKEMLINNGVWDKTFTLAGNHDCYYKAYGEPEYNADYFRYLSNYLSYTNEIGNLLFIGMSDECDLECVEGVNCGPIAGWISDESVDWYESQVVNNQDKIIITL